MADSSDIADEIEILHAAYSDLVDETLDGRTVAADGSRSLRVTVRPLTGNDSERQYVWATVRLKLPKDYPSTVPEVTVESSRGLGDSEIVSFIAALRAEAEKWRGDLMLSQLVQHAMEVLTEVNRPSENCAVCMSPFDADDAFMKTECFHYFHRPCIAAYLDQRIRNPPPTKDDDDAAKQPAHIAPCPVCRAPFDTRGVDLAGAGQFHAAKDNADDSGRQAYLRQQKHLEAVLGKSLQDVYAHQLAVGGIIDLEKEERKYRLDSANPIYIALPSVAPVTDSGPPAPQPTQPSSAPPASAPPAAPVNAKGAPVKQESAPKATGAGSSKRPPAEGQGKSAAAGDRAGASGEGQSGKASAAPAVQPQKQVANTCGADVTAAGANAPKKDGAQEGSKARGGGHRGGSHARGRGKGDRQSQSRDAACPGAPAQCAPPVCASVDEDRRVDKGESQAQSQARASRGGGGRRGKHGHS